MWAQESRQKSPCVRCCRCTNRQPGYPLPELISVSPPCCVYFSTSTIKKNSHLQWLPDWRGSLPLTKESMVSIERVRAFYESRGQLCLLLGGQTKTIENFRCSEAPGWPGVDGAFSTATQTTYALPRARRSNVGAAFGVFPPRAPDDADGAATAGAAACIAPAAAAAAAVRAAVNVTPCTCGLLGRPFSSVASLRAHAARRRRGAGHADEGPFADHTRQRGGR